MMRMRTFIAAAALTAAVLTGCGQEQSSRNHESAGDERIDNSGTAGQGAKDSVVVVMTPGSEPEAGFDPAYGWGAGEHVHEPLIQSTLTVTTSDLSIDYDLATEIACSEDGLLWTVDIRNDAKFTDGETLTAKDVAFTYNTLRDTSSVNDFTMLKEAVAVDSDTVEFHMTRPYSIWPYTMAIVGIVPEHAYDADYGQNPVGSGRYILKQWDRGQQVVLEANPDYYGPAPGMKKVTILFMEEDAAYAAVLSGQADLAYTAASYGEGTIDGYSLLDCETVDNRGFNLPAVPRQTLEDGTVIGNDLTCDVRVRRAINLAVDREMVIENVLDGFGTPAYSVCDKMPWYYEGSQVIYDLEQAKALMEEAGWLEGSDGIREKVGFKAELEIAYPSGDSVRQAMASETANQLKDLGIDASARGVSWEEAYTIAYRQPLMWGWGAHTPMELYNIYHTEPGSGSARYSPYASQTVDQYMDEALASLDLESSYQLWKKAQWDGSAGITQDGDIPWIWLANVDHLYWVRSGLSVAEQKLHPHGHGWSIVNNVDLWSWND